MRFNKGEAPSFEERASHLARLEMDEPPHSLREMPHEDPVDRAIRAIEELRLSALSSPPQSPHAFLNVLGTSTERIVRHASERERAVESIRQFMDSLGDPARLEARRHDIEKHRPLLENHERTADWEMYLADHIYSNPHHFSGHEGMERLNALDKILTNSKLDIAGRPFDLTGIKGLAGAIAIIGSKQYVPFFPDPLLDVLLKIDAIGYDKNTDHHILAQIKTRRGLRPALPIIDTPRAFFERSDARNVFRDDQLYRLADDALVLELAAEAFNKNYRGNFTPLLMVMPSFDPNEVNQNFNTQTGLPNRTTLDTINWPREV